MGLNQNLALEFTLLSLLIFLMASGCDQQKQVWQKEWQCEVYPPEHLLTNDAQTGAQLRYITTHPGKDVNLYFDLNCWTADQSLLVFYSDRSGRQELFGYLPQSGEIVRLQPDDQSPAYNATVDYQSQDLYVVRDNCAYQWHVEIHLSAQTSQPSEVRIRERKITAAPDSTTFFMGFTESADGRYLSAGLNHTGSEQQDIIALDIESGDMRVLYSGSKISHVQFSKYNPNLLRFSHSPQRMWYIDLREAQIARPLHQQEPGELVTHEDWWIDDQMTFCGGYREEESHVKLIDIHSGLTRIIGAGSWWPEKTPRELSQVNWWHASGARDGRWVAADNWHGHIAIIDARTSHLRLLTKNHRPYGNVGVEHPHVGWAPDSKSVEFTSHALGNANVCIAYLPKEWDDPFINTYQP
ncbi:MAG: hypothetical protein E4H13_09110 [Calditrichales bacterium]|nr:MAG: hypothetical protein E4H13_09110 [Calditrichales bacterium]